jgi:hypothetical protein
MTTFATTSIDTWSRVTPLAVRFVDQTTQHVVGTGLRVTAWPVTRPNMRASAVLNTSQTFIFNDLPGIRSLEFGAGDDAYWVAVQSSAYTVEVTDDLGRFLAFRFRAQAPHRGLFQLPCLPPIEGSEALLNVPLWSAPSRLPLSPWSIWRADLWDATAQRPAAFAVVDVHVAGSQPSRVFRGVADSLGRIALHVPCPLADDFDGSPFDSPAGGPSVPLAERQWHLNVSALFGPVALAVEPSALQSPIPDLCSMLAQSKATLWADDAQTEPLASSVMKYSQETVARTRGSSGQFLTKLFLTSTP